MSVVENIKQKMGLIRSTKYETTDDGNTEKIIKAIKEGNFSLARSLIGRKNINSKDESGATLIVLVCKSCELESEEEGLDFIIYLLKRGADMDKKDKYGKTALDYATDNGLKIIQDELIFAKCIKEFF